jgi:DNA polymerase-3 subunit alpha
MSDPRFIHLRLHTEYSLLEGAMRVKKLTVAPIQKPAKSVPDCRHARRGGDRHQQHVLRAGVLRNGGEGGVQPILGCQVDVDHAPVRAGGAAEPIRRAGSAGAERDGLAQPAEAEHHLYLRNDGTLPHVTLEELARMARG